MERDELIAFAENKGLKVDRRLGDEKLRESIEAQLAEQGEAPVSRDWGDEAPAPTATETSDPDPEPEPVVEPPVAEPVEDEWPKRIAPCAWLDQDGNRWTDLGQAGEAVEAIRRRT